jgi:hypothetical protein
MKIDTTRVTVVLILAVILLISLYFVVRYTITAHNRTTAAELETLIFNQEKLLISLAEATRVNGADSATERIIIDCKADERQRFDTLLDLLSTTISNEQLRELNTLFYKCGSFYADRKSVMATRLIREVEVFSEYVTLRNILSKTSFNNSPKIEAWQKLAEAELKTAEYFNQLVLHQGTIINLLNTGKIAASPEVVAVLGLVSTVRGQMLVLGTQIEVYKLDALTL